MTQYLEITSLSATPASAEYGESVFVGVYVKNIWTAGMYIIVAGHVDGTDLMFGDEWKDVPSEYTVSWSQYFTMPNKSVSVVVSAWYWVEDVGWIKNDEKVISVELEGVTPEGDIEIVSLTMPSSASVGDTVQVSVTVRNTFPVTKTITVEGAGNITPLPFSPSNVSLATNATQVFTTSFVMPNQDVLVAVGTYYQEDSNWYESKAVSRRVSLEAEEPEPEPEPDIVITKVELEYDETRGVAPVSGVPLGNRGLVHVYRKNNGTTAEKVCVAWTVAGPTGTTIESYQHCELFTTTPGETDEFIGDRFDLPVIGTYRINVLLYISPDLTTPIDSYDGVLCVVVEEPEEPPDGDGDGDGEGITSLTIFHGTPTLGVTNMVETIPPVSGVTTGDVFKLRVVGVNPSTSAQQMGLHYIITKPDESVIEATIQEAWPYTGGGDSHEFSEPEGPTTAIEIDQAGEWFLSVELLAGGVVIDTWEGLIFDVAQAPASVWDVMQMIPYMMIIMVMSMIMESMPAITETARRELPKLPGRAVAEVKKRIQPQT